MRSPTEELLDLIRAAQRGDEGACDRIFRRYQDRLRMVIRLRLGRKLRGVLDSGDVLQETLLAAVKSFDRFEARDEASLLNWLSKIAEHQIQAAAEHHGAQKRDVGRNVPLQLQAPDLSTRNLLRELVGASPTPIDSVVEAEQAAAVEACVAALPEDLRELIVLRDYMQAPWDTVADECGRPSASAARMMHARALVELGKCLRSRGF